MSARDRSPMIIAHRGASGERPEHTIAGYVLAIEQGADFIEPDLVATKDGVLVARHENEIGGTTDVGARTEFASRRTRKAIDGELVDGWFTEDFTLSELKSLRCRERLPQLRKHNAQHDGVHQVPTFEEIVSLAQKAGRDFGRPIGVYPETKHPTYFRGIGLALEERLLALLDGAGWNNASAPVFIQSFETGNLRVLREHTGVRLIQLIGDADEKPYDRSAAGLPGTYADLLCPAGLEVISEYAFGIGPAKSWVIPRDQSGRLLQATDVVADAHRYGLQVHPWTFRSENEFLPLQLRLGADEPEGAARLGDWSAEYHAFFDAGVDALFSDWPRHAHAARAAWIAARAGSGG